MENFKGFLGIILVIIIGWHIKVGFSPDTKLSGLFQETPELGYSWKEIKSNIGGLCVKISIEEESKFPIIQSVISGGPAEKVGIQTNDFITMIENVSTEGMSIDQVKNILIGEIGSSCNIIIWRNGTEMPVTFTRQKIQGLDDYERLNNAYTPTSHYFWDNNNVVWCPGFVHPNFNVEATELKDTWKALPGYELTGIKEGDLSTIWKQGLKHPQMYAISSPEEGIWIASLGYKFVMQDGLAINTIWTAGTQYSDLKITAADKEGYFNPFPGYKFKNSDENLDVVWTPGLKDPNNPYKISGDIEGVWVDESQTLPSEPTWQDDLATSVGTSLTADLIEWLFGKNYVSNELNKKSGEALLNSAIKGFNELRE